MKNDPNVTAEARKKITAENNTKKIREQFTAAARAAGIPDKPVNRAEQRRFARQIRRRNLHKRVTAPAPEAGTLEQAVASE